MHFQRNNLQHVRQLLQRIHPLRAARFNLIQQLSRSLDLCFRQPEGIVVHLQ